ncbi:DUF2752 domain-containing protein [Stomatobaculum longum]|jgi:hypothetical protein|uniref:DUF2752 domain-containing protein n=1 Tax=Stomatobaculum longum TaxID=796942 RepID=UPI0028E2EEFD|nr:DUF2752 domain-containing protein [Stomatobaculum longum]
MKAAEVQGTEERRRAVGSLTARIVLLGLAYALFIQCTGLGIPCVFRLVTGYRCPGCGMTHAAMALIHGQPKVAFRENPLSLSVAPLLLLYGAYRAEVYIRTARTDFRKWEIVFLGVLWVVVLLFWLLRNLL